MKISIITISFNAAETIEETIKSVISQDYPDVEYIVVDGASTDQTTEIIKKYHSDIDRHVSEPDGGIYDGMNKGVLMASGEFIGILNADDVYAHPQVISRVVQALKASGANAAYADLQYVQRNDISKVTRYWKAGAYERSSFLKGWMPPHPTFFLNRKCYEKHGLYRTRLRSSADYELMLRMLYKHEIPAVYLPEVIVKMKLGGQSNVSLANRLRANKEDRLAWKMNGIKPAPFTFVMKPMGKISQFFRR